DIMGKNPPPKDAGSQLPAVSFSTSEIAEALRRDVRNVKGDSGGLAKARARIHGQLRRALKGITKQLGRRDLALLDNLSKRRKSDLVEEIRIARALLDTVGLDRGPRITSLTALLTDDEKERTQGILAL